MCLLFYHICRNHLPTFPFFSPREALSPCEPVGGGIIALAHAVGSNRAVLIRLAAHPMFRSDPLTCHPRQSLEAMQHVACHQVLPMYCMYLRGPPSQPPRQESIVSKPHGWNKGEKSKNSDMLRTPLVGLSLGRLVLVSCWAT